MNDPVVYRSDVPSVITAWTDACDALEQYLARTRQILKDAGLGEYEIYRRNGWNSGMVAGIGIPAGGEVPEGWRMQPAYERVAVPDKRRAAGKTVSAALEAVPHPGVRSSRLPGMPAYVLAGGRMLTPGVRLLDSGAALWAEWARDPETATRGAGSIDKTLWSREPLSRYFTAVEAPGQAAEAAEGMTP